MTSGSTIVPAFGRDYKTKKAIIEDLREDKDFIVADMSSRWDGKAVNRSQLLAEDITKVWVRYKKLTEKTQIDLLKPAKVWKTPVKPLERKAAPWR